MKGDRLTALVDFETLKLVAGLLLTSPYVPMLFMGEEYGESAPFPFFTSHGDGRVIDNVRRGRKQGFASFGWHGEPFDPQDEHTFHRAKLQLDQARHGRGKTLHDWHRELLRLRRALPALAQPDRRTTEVILREENQLLCVRRGAGAEQVLLVFHFGTAPAQASLPFAQGPGARCWIQRMRRGRAPAARRRSSSTPPERWNGRCRPGRRSSMCAEWPNGSCGKFSSTDRQNRCLRGEFVGRRPGASGMTGIHRG